MLTITDSWPFRAGEPPSPPEFDGTVFDVLERNGLSWLKAGQIGAALQLEGGEAALLDLHQSRWYEFTEALFARLPVETPEGPRAVPAFSPLGAYVAATLVATPVAARFRRWLLERIDGFWTDLAREAERLARTARDQGAELRRLAARIEALEAERDRQAEELARLSLRLERAEVGVRHAPIVAIRPSLAESPSPRAVIAFGGPGRPRHPVAGLAGSLSREPARRSGFRGLLGPLASPRSMPRSGGARARRSQDFAPDGPIPVCAGEIGGKSCQVVDVRDLHRFLGLNLHVTTWVRSRIAEYGFAEDEDYAYTQRRGREHPQGGRPAADYRLSLGMAEALARFERSEKGREARRWLAECREKLAERALAERLGTPPPESVAGNAAEPARMGLPLFRFDEHPIRIVVDEQGRNWWCAKDVCAVLGYKNESQTVADHCRAEGVSKRYPLKTAGGIQYPNFINEANLYRLVAKSQKPEAERFERWVFEEVLPALARTGRYERAAGGVPEPDRPLTADSAPPAETLPADRPRDASLLFNFVGHPVRVEIRRGAALFIARDVAEALGYRWSGFTGIFAQIPGAERTHCRIETDTPVGLRELAAITEAGLRRLLEVSGQPKDLREGFRAWLEETVRPELRRREAEAGPSSAGPEAGP
jgi:prophage antirepressor-like protein/phage anti-repressor protein